MKTKSSIPKLVVLPLIALALIAVTIARAEYSCSVPCQFGEASITCFSDEGGAICFCDHGYPVSYCLYD